MNVQSMVKRKRHQLEAQSWAPAHGVGPTQTLQTLLDQWGLWKFTESWCQVPALGRRGHKKAGLADIVQCGDPL